jgi:uncharacterized Zn-finger protein
MENENPEPLTFLTLGDGDFTYSLDLARYLTTSFSNPANRNNKLIATGIDSSKDLVAKYKDSPFVLQQLQSVNSTSQSSLVSIQHEVNAIVTHHADDTVTTASADCVMFHHPHLGTEDAALHGRFLCHFLDSCTNYWMKPKGGILHLTLVEGQYERWNVARAAERQDLVLLQRTAFCPPPVRAPTYHYRRHQTGKSFESRRPNGSETFSFGRKCDEGMYRAQRLPWQESDVEKGANKPKVDKTSNELSCPYCDKTFREERSRKCHVRDKHPNGADKKQKTSTSGYPCDHCQTEDGEPRTFVSEQALKDHVRAKHAAIHNHIIPDWHQHQATSQQEVATTESETPSSHDLETSDQQNGFGMCSICGLKYRDAGHESSHALDFLPTEATETFQCSFCTKTFREKRAKLQHENFCSRRVPSGNK